MIGFSSSHSALDNWRLTLRWFALGIRFGGPDKDSVLWPSGWSLDGCISKMKCGVRNKQASQIWSFNGFLEKICLKHISIYFEPSRDGTMSNAWHVKLTCNAFLLLSPKIAVKFNHSPHWVSGLVASMHYWWLFLPDCLSKESCLSYETTTWHLKSTEPLY